MITALARAGFDSMTGDDLRQAIYAELGNILPKEAELEHSYVRLGALLTTYKAGEYWRGSYPNFDAFMMELRSQYNRGRTQLYGYLAVAERLLPLVPAQTLNDIGISKALELKRAIKKGHVLTPEIIAAAADSKTTIKELRATLAVTFIMEDEPRGNWYDFDGAFLTTEEKKQFEDAVRMTVALLGLDKSVPAHVQRKEIFLAWASEFMGTHAVEVYGPAPEQEPSDV